MADHHPNNVEAAIEHKRVSFGGEEHVQMIVYDDGLTDDYSINNQNKHNSRHNTAFTEPDAPPNRVKVTAESAQLPRPISPPAQIGLSPAATMSHSTDPITYPAASSAAGTSGVMPSTATTMVSSPPLPSFTKRAEHENENPFRPDELLYHEVDTIVEAYRQRPFPPSPTHGSPVPPHQQQTPSSWSTPTKRNSGNIVGYANGRGGGRNNSLAQARRGQTPAAEADQLLMSNNSPTDGIGPPHKAEVIRLEEEKKKKKKRACCNLQ